MQQQHASDTVLHGRAGADDRLVRPHVDGTREQDPALRKTLRVVNKRESSVRASQHLPLVGVWNGFQIVQTATTVVPLPLLKHYLSVTLKKGPHPQQLLANRQALSNNRSWQQHS